METGQERVGSWDSFDRLWANWLTVFGYQSCPYCQERKWENFNPNHTQALAFLQKEPNCLNHSYLECELTYPAFCHFTVKRNNVLVSCVCDKRYITNVSKMFTIILESSPLLAIKKTSSRESTS